MSGWIISLVVLVVGKCMLFDVYFDDVLSAICAGLAAFGFRGRITSKLCLILYVHSILTTI